MKAPAWKVNSAGRRSQNLRPAFTGVVQATAIAPTALLAEVHAKSALLAGPEEAARWLPFGGVLVLDDGEVETVGARAELPAAVTA